MKSESIVFIPTTFKAFEIVRDSAKCNMFDGTCVMIEMVNNGYIDEALQLVRESSVDSAMSSGIRVDTKVYGELLKQVKELYNTTAKMTDTSG